MSEGKEGGASASSLEEAVSHIDKLDELLLSAVENNGNNINNLEIVPRSIVYQVNFDTNFEDRNGFITGIAKYMEEATVHAALNELLEEGEKHAVTLYTWRCCTRGIPQPSSNEDPNREQIHAMTVEVLSPEVEKLYSLIKFQKIAIDRFCAEVKILCHAEKRKEFVSSAYLLTLGKFINMFAVLDELKNIKSSVKIDFSGYRRAAMFLKLMSDSQSLQESQNLSVFLATPNKIRDNLRESLEKIQNYEDVLADVINICVSMFEQRLYVTMQEKHMLVKVIGFCIGLVDNSRCYVYKLDSKKKIRIDKIDRIFRSVVVVPLFGDMHISPFNYIKNSCHFDPSKWPLCSSSSSTSSYARVELVKLLPQISQDHLKYMNELQYYNGATTVPSETENENILNLALKGLQHLSEWTSAVMELYSWKLLHPTDHHQNKDCPQNAEEYERATRYNYTDEEKTALVHVIVMIKGLQDMMSKMEGLFSEGIRRDVYLKLQTFVQATLREPLRKATKHKKQVLKSVLMSIRDTCADWIGGRVHQSFEKGSVVDVKILKRFVGPSSTQLYLLRTMLESLISEKTCAKRSLRKDLDTAHLPVIEEFHRRTFFWSYLLNFSQVLEKCCDLGQMWYREFYLELTNGQRVQFPIEMSLPWILVDHALSHPNLVEFVLFPLDIYNDSAHCALNIFKKQWLFDELIAEVNLCFDQFVFKLSEQIFAHYKRRAAVGLLNKKFKKEWDNYEGVVELENVNYEGLMKQRRVYVVGHYIDLNKLICQRVSYDLLKSLQAAIAKFRENDITGVVQLESLIMVNRETHLLLKNSLPSLNDFESFWREADQCVTARFGKTMMHIIDEITGDLVLDYAYNGSYKRFVKTKGVTYSKRNGERSTAPPVPSQYLWGSKQLNAAFSMIFSQYSGFVGEQHFRVIVSLIGYQGIALLVNELTDASLKLINGGIRQWIKVLKESVLPKYIRPPSNTLDGTPALLAYYLQVLDSLVQHPGVKMELFQLFRRVGNAIVLCILLEQSLAVEESLRASQSAAFHGGTSQTTLDTGNVQKMMKALHVTDNISQFGTEIQRNLAKEADLLEQELLTLGLKIFPGVLKKIQQALLEVPDGEISVWKGPPPVHHVMNTHRCGEFHRVWSALQFICCIPVGSNELSVEQLFGDGLNWAGCLMIALLDQERRFQVFDFCNHLRESYRDDDRDGDVRGINVRQIAGRIRSHQLLNASIFALASKYLKDSEVNAAVSENVRCYFPPIHKSLMENLPQDMEGKSPDAILQYHLQKREVEAQENAGAVAAMSVVKKRNEMDENENQSDDMSDRWEDFKFLDNMHEGDFGDKVVEIDGDARGDCGSVSILYQSDQNVEEISSVSCVGGSKNNE